MLRETAFVLAANVIENVFWDEKVFLHGVKSRRARACMDITSVHRQITSQGL
jgi:hypothetical protein